LVRCSSPLALNPSLQWLRSLSKRLDASFEGSAAVEQTSTKGESRESQILDVLNLLPGRASVHKNVVIADCDGGQSRKFDAVVLDRQAWPLLFSLNDMVVAMVESVLVAHETKSSLNASELEDIWAKVGSLRALKYSAAVPLQRPVTTAFAYRCPNMKLSFFDYCHYYVATPEGAPAAVCILNQGIFCLSASEGDRLVAKDQAAAGVVPTLIAAGADSLLVYLYLLCRWVTGEPQAAEVLMEYSQGFADSLTAFHFDDDFLRATADAERAKVARQCFTGSQLDVQGSYKKAREQLQLGALDS